MGGVNFTRNRAWWHTAIWDEYGQRHQYMCIFPCMVFLFPMYWYGTFVNRQLEQNFAAKMYQLDYENRRNRLTHNLIMEHFESHVEKVQAILDQVKKEGFETTFAEEIKDPQGEKIPFIFPGIDEQELMAEVNETSGYTSYIDGILEHTDLPYWMRQEFNAGLARRKRPNSDYQYINQFSTFTNEYVRHVYLEPFKGSLDAIKQLKDQEVEEE